MLFGQGALILSAAFFGAAFYINFSEQPARLALDDHALLAEWKPSYKRGFLMQGSLAIAAAVLALVAWVQLGDWRWLLTALLMAANWPYTLVAIMPTNSKLMATPLVDAGAAERALIVRWGWLHAARAGLGFASVLAATLALSGD